MLSDSPSPNSSRLLFIPAILLIGCLGLFVILEYHKFTNNDVIREIIEDKASSLVSQLEAEVLQLSSSVEEKQETDVLQEKIKAINFSITRMFNFFLRNETRVIEYTEEQRKLEGVLDSLKKIKNSLEKKNHQKVEEGIKNLYKATHELTFVIAAAHERDTHKLLENLAKEKERRMLFGLFIILLVLGLISIFFEAIYRYQQHAQRAKAAERINALFAGALQSTRMGVLIRDMRKKDTPVVFVNKAFENMTGYKFSEIPSDDATFLFGWKTDNATISSFRRAVSLRESATFNLSVYRKDGTPFWSEWHMSPILGADGEVVYFVSLFNDMTVFRQTQEDLIQAKLMAERASTIKTNFLAMMSHEIRTPINGIQGVLKLIDETALDEEQKHLLGIAITSSKALHRIINDILDYAKMEAGKVEIISEPFLIQSLFDDVLALAGPMKGNKNVELDVIFTPGLPPCFVSDVGRLHQIFLNLVSNALKFTEEGFVRIRVIPLLEQKVNNKDGMLVRFEVQDSGMGISSLEQERLFKEFSQIDHSSTRRFGGTGLGLAICKRLVTMLGGEIGVESQPGKGSKFWFMLPLEIAIEEDLSYEEAQNNHIHDKQKGKPPRNFTILLVEDNDTNRFVAGRYLQKAGFKVEEACNGVIALAMTKKKNYDLILMDVSMPEMDGMLATCHIRAEGGYNAKVPIIALTAHVMAGDRDLCLEVGMNDYLNKPIEYNELLKALERWLHVSFPQKSTLKILEQKAYGDRLPDFDFQQLELMKKTLGGEAVQQITDMFLMDSSVRIQALADPNISVVRESAHTLKSSSANCGLIRFGHLMGEVELAASQGEAQTVALLLKDMQKIYETGTAALRQHRKTYID